MAIREEVPAESRNLVEMSWDPITRIVGNLGIYTKIDFDNREVVECKSTSSIFRGYSVFMKGKDPRDAHFITSRICGICGDNHAVCSVYAQNMAYGIAMPPLAEWIYNLGEAAEYMFDHTIFQDNLVFVDYCEQLIRETNPSLLERAEQTEASHADVHGYRTIADIMRAFNPFTGEVYKEALNVSRITREMFCLMEGRHVHPSTIYPGGTGTVATPQVFTDYLSRLMRCLDFIKQAVPMNDDVFNFFYEALPGYEEVGRRRTLLGCWSAFQNPDECDYKYENMAEWGRAAFVTPGIIVDGELVTTSLVDINLGIRILLGSSYYEDWENEETFVTHDPLGNPVDKRHPWNQTTLPKPQKRDLEGGKYSWVMSPRWLDKRSGDHLALDTGGGAIARLWATALAGLVDTPYVKAIGRGFHEAVRGVLSHHLVIRDGKIANYHPYPPTPWNGSPTDSYGTPGPYEDAVAGTPIFEENGPDNFKGIDIMRSVRSFDPCLPCGVHMYSGEGKILEQRHSPTLGLGVE